MCVLVLALALAGAESMNVGPARSTISRGASREASTAADRNVGGRTCPPLSFECWA